MLSIFCTGNVFLSAFFEVKSVLIPFMSICLKKSVCILFIRKAVQHTFWDLSVCECVCVFLSSLNLSLNMNLF